MKIELLEKRQLLSHGAENLLVLGDATLVNDQTPFLGQIYNGFEQDSAIASYQAFEGELTRVSFLDPDGDLVFAEFGGAGTLNISLEDFSSGNASPYDQPDTTYAQGLATFTLFDTDASTFFSVFSLGNDADRVNPAIITDTSLDGADGVADVRAVVVLGDQTTTNFIGGVNAANAEFTGGDGRIVGINAGNVRFTDFLRIGNINTAGQSGLPQILIDPFSTLGEDGGAIQINGGDIDAPGGIDTGGFPLPIDAVDGQLSIDGQNIIASRDVDGADFDSITDADISRDSDLSVLFRVTAATTQADVDAFFDDSDAYQGKEVIVDTTDPVNVKFDFNITAPDGVGFDTTPLVFDIDIVDSVIMAQSFDDLRFEQDVDGLLVTTDGSVDIDPDADGVQNTPNAFDVGEGGINDVIFEGIINDNSNAVGISIEAHTIGNVQFGISDSTGLDDDEVIAHAGAGALVSALGTPDNPSSIGNIIVYNSSGTSETLDLDPNSDFAAAIDGDIGSIDFKGGDFNQDAGTGYIVHLTDSDVEDGTNVWAGPVSGTHELEFTNFAGFSSTFADPGNNDPDVADDEASFGDITAGTNLTLDGVLVTNGGDGVNASVGNLAAEAGDVTLAGGAVVSGVTDLGDITAMGSDITIVPTTFTITGNLGLIDADNNVSIDSLLTVGGDAAGIHGDGVVDIDANVDVGGDFGDLWAGGGAGSGVASLQVSGDLTAGGSFGNVKGSLGIDFSGGGSITADSIGNVTVEDGVLTGSDGTTEFNATDGNIGNVSVTNGDTTATDSVSTDGDLLTDAIFLASDGDIGDVSLLQGTAGQSIASSGDFANAAGAGVGFAASGNLGNVDISGTTSSTVMDAGTTGGLFFLAGDDNGPAAGGDATAGASNVRIGTISIEGDLTTGTTFGDANDPGGSLTIASGVTANVGGVYVTGTDGQNIDDADANVSTSGAEGTIDAISLNDISVGSTSGLVDASQGLGVTGGTGLASSAVVIGDVLTSVSHLRDGSLQTLLSLSSDPSNGILHVKGGSVSTVNPLDGDLIIVTL